jgi:hypothetical protein
VKDRYSGYINRVAVYMALKPRERAAAGTALPGSGVLICERPISARALQAIFSPVRAERGSSLLSAAVLQCCNYEKEILAKLTRPPYIWFDFGSSISLIYLKENEFFTYQVKWREMLGQEQQAVI